jgi:trk system potassium uptake protein TrkA
VDIPLYINVPSLELVYPLSGAKCLYQLHSLYNQAPKKVILYEKQYNKASKSVHWTAKRYASASGHREEKMKIIIIGDGKVGFSLAENLSKENHEITIIDKNMDTLKKTIEFLDVMCICGNGVSTSILIEAGVNTADLLIAATSLDEMNMVCCLTAKKLGVKHTVARIRDTQYADELSQLTTDLGLDMVINPERALASEISRMLQFPPAIDVETFARGRVEMIEIKVTGSMDIVNMAIKNIAKKYFQSILIAAILRNTQAIIPNGDVIIHEGDSIYIVGVPARIFDFCKKLGLHMNKIKSCMIMGGGRVSYYLAKYLDEIGMKVKIIEINRQRCEELGAGLPSALIIHGDGSDDMLLKSERISDMDAFISVTGHDEDNLMSALLAKQAGVHKVIAKISRLSYSKIIRNMGVDNLVDPKSTITNDIIRFVRGLKNATGNHVKTLYQIVDGQVEALEFFVGSNAKIVDIPLKRLELKPGVLIAAITRGENDTIIPHGNDKIQAGDNVIVVTRNKTFYDLNDIIAD